MRAVFGFEDEILVEYVASFLEDFRKAYPDPRVLHINVRGFLDKDADQFMSALYTWLLDYSAREGIAVS